MSIGNVILAAANIELPNAKLLRLLRLGRVVRIFKSLKNLQKIISATAASGMTGLPWERQGRQRDTDRQTDRERLSKRGGGGG